MKKKPTNISKCIALLYNKNKVNGTTTYMKGPVKMPKTNQIIPSITSWAFSAKYFFKRFKKG